jgi:enoyl-CoA hydratase/carnithine racemase
MLHALNYLCGRSDHHDDHDLRTRQRPAGRVRTAAGQPPTAVLHVRLNRPAKRNALSDPLIAAAAHRFVNLPEACRPW